MAYSVPPIVLDGDTINGTWLTTYIRDNFKAVWPYTTAGDIAVAAGPTTLSRLPVGTNGQILTMQSGAPAWGEGLPSGVVMDYAGASIPTGWLACDGAAVSRTTYAALFSALGTTFGAGNGTTTFNLPDGRGRATIGVGTGTGLTARALGSAVGEEAHALSTVELASHNHTQDPHNHTQNAHDHTTGASSIERSYPSGVRNDMLLGGTPPNMGGATGSSTATNVAATATNQNTGSGTAHNTMQPSLALNKIIKI